MTNRNKADCRKESIHQRRVRRRKMIRPIHPSHCSSLLDLVVSSSSDSSRSKVDGESHGLSSSSCSGSSLDDDFKKRTVTHNYHDHARESPSSMDVEQMQQDEEDSKKRRGPRGGVAQPFPEKLHLMLSTVNRDDIVSWQPHGRCFVVHNAKAFVNEVMPTYFRQTKLTSFQRQLNLYGFCRLTSGRDRGGYYHELFLRNRPFLCKRMMRTRIKGTGIKAASSPQTEVSYLCTGYLQPERCSSFVCSCLTLIFTCTTARFLSYATRRGLGAIVWLRRQHLQPASTRQCTDTCDRTSCDGNAHSQTH
jgi:hypothetical protein